MAVGNDLVDLDAAANLGKHRDCRFVERVFTGYEQTLIANSLEPDRVLWSLWAAKEAIFKIEVRTNPTTIFAHARFEVLHHDPSMSAGLVRYQDRIYSLWWDQAPGHVHAWGHRQRPGTVLAARVAAIAEPQSRSVRALATGLLAEAGYPDCQISGRPPMVVFAGQGMPIGISLSHDGIYGAVVISLVDQKTPAPSEHQFEALHPQRMEG